MRARMRVPSEPLTRSGAVSEEWARIDPMVYAIEARRAQARAVAEALGATRRGLRQGISGLAALGRRPMERLARRSERRRAIAQLTRLDSRLLADIGLRRSDIELAVDGLLADPRVTRRAPAPVVTEQPLQRPHRPMPAVPANADRPAAPAQDRVADLAA